MKKLADRADGDVATQLIVFSDDWGRHPSSCQHLIGHLLHRYPVLWVNTIGTRSPRLSWEDAGKAWSKLRQWAQGEQFGQKLPSNLAVINPRMYPGFSRQWQRRINAKAICAAVNRALGPRSGGEKRIAITTIAITSDLIGKLDVDYWVYYCVDDFSVWPGLHGQVLDAMERQLVAGVDQIVTVSRTLGHRIADMGRDSVLLTHGIDMNHWQARSGVSLPRWWKCLSKPVLLFWGVVDQRLDYAWCRALAQRCGTLALVGPVQSPDARLAKLQHVKIPGPVPYAQLPVLAEAADVLVMPYADLPVTRAIEPLKFKEYLATGKPVVVRKLPATQAWAEAADVVDAVEDLTAAVMQRIREGVPASQRQVRRSLDGEAWTDKAQQFERVLLGH